MAFAYTPSKWCTSLWRGHIDVSRLAQTIVNKGSARQPDFPRFAQIVHDTLYLRHAPLKSTDTLPEWAATLVDTAEELPQWHTLRAKCALDGFAAGVAATSVLQALLPMIPEAPPSQSPQQGKGQSKPQKDAHPTPSPGQGRDADEADAEQAVRKAVRQACAIATEAVNEAEMAMEPLRDALGIQAGTGVGTHETLQDLAQIRQCYEIVCHNRTLARIAEMAGRLVRLGQAHKKTKIAPAVGGIVDVVMGGDIPLILPSELVGLRAKNRLLRLSALHKVLARQALQYLTEGKETLARGPIIVCVDESGSMEAGEKPEIWAKAVVMALLIMAGKQKRAFHVIGFAHGITFEQTVLPGTMTLETIMGIVNRQSGGGTEFDSPLRAALDMLKTCQTMQKADVVFITDGEASISPDVIADFQAVQQQSGVQLYPILIGKQAARRAVRFQPLSKDLYLVHGSRERDSVTIAPVIMMA